MRLSNKTIVHVTLPERFLDDLKVSAYDEIRIAQKKYDIHLTEDEKDKVFFHSFKQLESKMKEIARTEWRLNHNVVKIKVDDIVSQEINLPQDEELHKGKKLLRASKRWVFDHEDDSRSIAIEDMTTEVPEMMLKFIRTAVMYGVGSYV